MMSRVSVPRGQVFGLEMQKFLVAKNLKNADLSRKIARQGEHLSPQYIGSVAHGHKTVSPRAVSLISQALQLSKEDRERLHRAAALDAGFEIGRL